MDLHVDELRAADLAAREASESLYFYTSTQRASGFAFAGNIKHVTTDGAITLENAEMVFETGPLDSKVWMVVERCPAGEVTLAPGSVVWWLNMKRLACKPA